MAVLLIHHAANRGHDHPPGSPRALQACLEAGARVIEVDITPLADGEFALLHDSRLEKATNGYGECSALTATQVTRLRYTSPLSPPIGGGWEGGTTDEPVGLLSQAIALVHKALQDPHPGPLPGRERGEDPHPGPLPGRERGEAPHPSTGRGWGGELQLDLKPDAPLTDARLRRLLREIEPVRDHVRVTCVADWVLRRLGVLDAGLALGFDPLLYLEVADEGHPPEEEPDAIPFRVGAYGYRDDHPLASTVWGTTAEYLAARAEALDVLVPAGGVWYIHAPLLARMLDDGFDWIAYLHGRAVQVDAWTLDAGRPGHVELARRLVAAGVDRITTNDAPRLAASLRGAVEY